jgi:hypothetical protein
VPNGTYSLSAYVRSSGGRTAQHMKAIASSGTRQGNIGAYSAYTKVSVAGIQVADGHIAIGFPRPPVGPGRTAPSPASAAPWRNGGPRMLTQPGLERVGVPHARMGAPYVLLRRSLIWSTEVFFAQACWSRAAAT